MRILNKAAVASALSHADCVDALEPAMRAVSSGAVDMPLRQYLTIPDTNGGKFTAMPGYLADPRSFGIKLVAKYPREPDSPLGSHTGAVILFDAELGAPVCVLDGSEVTAIRTAAASALATRVLARRDAHVLTVLGTGLQAEHHVHAIRAVRDIDEVRVWGRNTERAAALADALPGSATAVTELADAVAGADIVCTTTSAREPFLAGALLEPGQHLNLVGAAIIEASEVDINVVRRSRVYVDYRPSARAQAGELAAADAAGFAFDDVVVAELGEVLAGSAPGRGSDDEITTYKSLGVSAQDLAAAFVTYHRAVSDDIGVDVDW
ncbi:MAG: ornithine cyclodeaminase family protein [Pseudomonadota bacterium]